ncbi:MAG: hypothetical protein OES12_01290, partial [Anaerolineae bacterium]|nr:hypothetical protein [Anaerolineae bacterium]
MSNYDRTADELSEQLVGIAAAAALEVGDMLVEAAIAAARGSVAKEQKASYHDLVTEYDRKSEQMIVQYILQQHPD